MRDNGTQPTRRAPPPYQSGQRAKDFVKCADPECRINKAWADRCKRFGWTADDYQPHCHPTF